MRPLIPSPRQNTCSKAYEDHDAGTLFHQGRLIAGRSRFPSASSPGAPIASITPPRIGGRASPRPLPADSSSSGPSGATLSPAAQPHGRVAGQRPPALGSPAVDPRGELSE